MENRVLGPTPEETTAAVTTSCGIGTSSPVASAPTNTVTGVGGSGALTSATCTIQNPVVVVASPPTKHQQPAAVLSTIPTVPTVPSVSGVTAAVPKILSRNINGTLVQTSVPQNEAELQLYRVMQRASLLSYYDTLLEMGGDDVQQLCDAGEEEFLEIMALVGMASKPLHVRRLQKALQEWLTNPSLFQTPVVPTTATCKAPAGIGFPCVSPRPQVQNLQGFTTTSQTATPTPYVSSHVSLTPLPCRSTSPIVSVTSVTAPVASTTFRQSPSPNTPLPYTTSHSPGILQVGTCESSCGSGTTPSPSGGGGAPASPTQPTPTLLQSQIQRLAEAAERLAATIRPVDPKPHNVKKKICKNLEMVMAMPDSDPRRMEEIRKYAAIYGRFDCKRKPEKPLTLHEVSVNEAAAQICSLSVSRPRENGEENEPDRTKRQKLELEGENEDATQEELDLRCPEMDIGNSTIRRHRSSSPVWRKKNNNGMFSASIEEISDSDSQLSFSNEESSSIHDTNEVEADNTDKESDFNLKVIASRGDNIIAVANPALMECNHPIKEEPTDEKPTL
ncbi:NGFI-A-binding protein homolog isoform X3 [Bombus vosnesenskii]|uniref:NGFI-A-binding protein homolog isoform X3 n=2 Tax=Pyrobombus TaxID=144703 RepID=A0A6J3L0K9_9HYME|nr:NGFI-A-binding protein homolog isoform X3 [Bombus impatiens]XP_033196148.1 NGFI-A-binding protein homolog isoform X3 [Bombus vancouverensis nearcticus]XP_033358860.1 NGFI-A-binding protein homolog isoform X3 [Bombus vosnesenskii]XP_050475448.1 NGFI-A-binding protein homolog isoform X3 [Bombus huntii]